MERVLVFICIVGLLVYVRTLSSYRQAKVAYGQCEWLTSNYQLLNSKSYISPQYALVYSRLHDLNHHDYMQVVTSFSGRLLVSMHLLSPYAPVLTS